MISGIDIVITGYDILLFINTRYWATFYLLDIYIAKKIIYRITNQ